MSKDFFSGFEGHDRSGFGDERIVRLTAGHGGESVMIIGSEKTALIDCGMAYNAKLLIENAKMRLAGRTLDYVLMSHTHYDHIGALPFVRQEWPKVICMGAEHAKSVFEKPGAIRTIRSLSENASKQYGHSGEIQFPENEFVVDEVLRDGDRVSLGDLEVLALETKGHTDCSMSFALEPQRIIFLSESTGVLESPEGIHLAILKSSKDAMDSLVKCRDYGARILVSPHFGVVPEYFNDTYWELFTRSLNEKRNFLFRLFQENLSDEEVFRAYSDRYWLNHQEMVQPKEAFESNAVNIIKVFLREFEELRACRE